MSLVDSKNELLTFIKEKHETINAVVMPDFFYDRLINVETEPAEFFSAIEDVTNRKGGSIDGITQLEIRGGNAINTASALASLGVKVTPIVASNEMGFQQIKSHLRRYRIDLSHVKIAKQASLTTALEFKTQYGKANVMLRDLGSLQNFGPSDLSETDYEVIEKADYVCVFNWAGTKKFGTALARNVFYKTRMRGKGKTYYDTADPTSNSDRILELMQNVLKTNLIDILSLNENEAISYAAILDDNIRTSQKKQCIEKMAIEAARVLVKHLTARIDLHTTAFSATFTKKKEVIAPTFKVNALRATGAGDAWNAGNILGDGCSLSDKCRLALANAVSAYYISNTGGEHPTLKKLYEFIKKSAFNTLALKEFTS